MLGAIVATKRKDCRLPCHARPLLRQEVTAHSWAQTEAAGAAANLPEDLHRLLKQFASAVFEAISTGNCGTKHDSRTMGGRTGKSASRCSPPDRAKDLENRGPDW